jgi:hypothetical protein
MSGPRWTLRHVLGSSGPDLGCDHSVDLLDQFVEAEQAGRPASETFPEVANHLLACPDCREDYVALTALLKDAGHPPGAGSA